MMLDYTFPFIKQDVMIVEMLRYYVTLERRGECSLIMKTEEIGMDRIKIAIEQEYVDDGAMFISVYINGSIMPNILDVEAFFAIKQQNGLVPLFTCGCGDFDCGGYYVNVSCTDTALVLHNSYHRFNRTLQSQFQYHLDWQEVRGVAEEILVYLQEIHKRNPQAYVTTGHGGENLLNRVPDYLESSILVIP